MNQPWEEHALCAEAVRRQEAAADWWHPTSKGKDHDTIRKAKRMCSDCPVWSECREYGKQNNLIGVWGGLLLVRDNSRKAMPIRA